MRKIITLEETVKNRQSGKGYWFRAAVVDTTNTLNYSDAVSRIVQ